MFVDTAPVPYYRIVTAMTSNGSTSFVPLNVAVLGAGLGGLSAALSLRRAGHTVTLYERYDFSGEVGASLSVASNGSRWIERWGVDVPSVKPVTLQRLIMHDWETGAKKDEYGLGDYKAKFGAVSALSLLAHIMVSRSDLAL